MVKYYTVCNDISLKLYLGCALKLKVIVNYKKCIEYIYPIFCMELDYLSMLNELYLYLGID